MRNLIVVLAVSSLLVGGCAATSGVEVTSEQASFVKKGVTTKAKLIEKLGAPTSGTVNSNGKEVLLWTYEKVAVDGATYIPVVGMFAGGSKSEVKSFSVTLDRRGIVTDYEFTGGQSTSRSALH